MKFVANNFLIVTIAKVGRLLFLLQLRRPRLHTPPTSLSLSFSLMYRKFREEGLQGLALKCMVYP